MLFKIIRIKIKKKISELDYDESKLPLLEKEKNSLETNVEQLNADINDLKAQLGSVKFNYSDPVPNFDKSQVKGMVVNLLKLLNNLI